MERVVSHTLDGVLGRTLYRTPWTGYWDVLCICKRSDALKVFDPPYSSRGTIPRVGYGGFDFF